MSIEIETERRCSTCRKEFLLTDFHRHKREQYGRAYECKLCKKKRDKEYRKRNKVKILRQKRIYDTKKALMKAIETNNINVVIKASNRLVKILNN